MLKASVFAVLIAFAAQPAVAAKDNSEGQAPAAATGKGKSYDPNRMVCQREETTGTRLGARKVCLTAAQWEEKRREHREQIERAQQNVGIKNDG
ncbi:MAG: hypothetical protein ACREXY_23550 [Gammaproteobacteria bacterium]